MQQDNDTLARFADIVAGVAQVDRAAVTPDARLRDDLGLDSLAMIDVAVAAEDAFDVRVPDEDVERFETVGDAVGFIQQARVAA